MSIKTRALLGIIILVLGVMACSLPGSLNPQTPVAPTPDKQLTITALYAALLTPAPTYPIMTATRAPDAAATATFVPTATSVPPTAVPTIEPTAANPTATPTVTPPPTLTAAPIVTRPYGHATARYLSAAPVIDGPWDEWSTTAYGLSSVIFGAGNWSGKTDLDASYRVGWNNSYLFLAFKVYDEKYVQNASGQNIFKGDSVEILLDNDLAGDYYTTTLNGDDYQLVVSPGNPSAGTNREAVLFRPLPGSGNRPQVAIGAVGGDGLYRVEVAIPWTVLGMSPVAGKHYGFAVRVNDNDNPDASEQQTTIANLSGNSLANPTTWGDLYLGW